jgi:ferric-dicitrate binding protein FerR (iron transport regulator)
MLCLGATSVRIPGERQQYASRMAAMYGSSEQIEQTAAEWLARQDGGEWGPSEEAALKAWLDASAAHRVAYLRLNEAWRRSQQLSLFAAKVPR